MTPREAVAYIERFTWSATRLGLERVRALLSALGEPQQGLKFVHVAGTNGKGSSCAMLEAVLRAAGYKTGLFISPHVLDFRERIQVDAVPISGGELAAATERVRAAADGMADHPSQFELLTAVAMVHFAARGCELVVLETGMGGELDATNAIDAPEAAVIARIGMDHMEYLGGSLGEIARTKAGIVKPRSAAVCYESEPEALAAIREVCREQAASLRVSAASDVEILSASLESQRIRWRGAVYDLALAGPHQARNAALVLETVSVLRERGWVIPEEAVAAGLRSVRWPARLELLGHKPRFLLDGGHNPQCAQALAESLRALLPGERPIFLVGVLRDKDYPGVLQTLLPLGERFICLTPESDRALPGEELAAFIRERGYPAEAYDAIPAGLAAALAAAGREGTVVAFGSLYLAGALRRAYGETKAALRRELSARRRGLSPAEREEKSAAICAALAALPELRTARTVLSYQALPWEADPADFHRLARERGITLAFPVLGEGRSMEALAPESPEALVPGPYGILAPDPARSRRIGPEELDAVLVPCLGFDRRCGRLGTGGGCYDRYLPRCPRAVRVALAFACQERPAVPRERHDRDMDLVITEDEVLRRQREDEDGSER